MKSVTHKTTLFTTLVLMIGLLISQSSQAIGKPYRGFAIGKETPAEDKPSGSTKTKTASSRNNNAVKIYPDIMKRSMHVVARENAGKQVDFFVFDLQGTLVQNVKMKEKDHLRIAGLARGKYVYRVFSGDEETASGEFEIR